MNNTHAFPFQVSSHQRAQQKQQRPCIVWFTGLSGAGKSTLANAFDHWLYRQGYHSTVLDGDNIRQQLNQDLGFSDKDRVENIRRIGEVASLMFDAGLIVSCAFISPFQQDRKSVRTLFPQGHFIEVFVKTPIDQCEQRDPKGIYKKARAGKINNFTGIDSPYEEPKNPEVIINYKNSLDTSLKHVCDVFLKAQSEPFDGGA